MELLAMAHMLLIMFLKPIYNIYSPLGSQVIYCKEGSKNSLKSNKNNYNSKETTLK